MDSCRCGRGADATHASCRALAAACPANPRDWSHLSPPWMTGRRIGWVAAARTELEMREYHLSEVRETLRTTTAIVARLATDARLTTDTA
jgi:hypothetical protein